MKKSKLTEAQTAFAIKQSETGTRVEEVCWKMDIVADALFAGRKIRCLTIVDNYSRQCMAIKVGWGL